MSQFPIAAGQLQVGQKALITVDNWFYAPDGNVYKAAWGTVRAVQSDQETLGIKTNVKSTNWYVQLGNLVVAGCQIHYAVRADQVHLGDVESYTEKDGQCLKYMRPGQIYNADGDAQ